MQVLISFMLQFNLNIIHVAKNQDSGTQRPKLISDMKMGVCRVWQYGFWIFQAGVTKLERFFHKNQHTQRKLLNFEFWING